MKKHLFLAAGLIGMSLSAMGMTVIAPPEAITYVCPDSKPIGSWSVQPSVCTLGATYHLTLGYPNVGQALYFKDNKSLTGYVYTLTKQNSPTNDFPYTIVTYNGSGNIMPGKSGNWKFNGDNASCDSHCDFELVN